MVSAAKLYKPKPVKTAIWILTAALVLALLMVGLEYVHFRSGLLEKFTPLYQGPAYAGLALLIMLMSNGQGWARFLLAAWLLVALVLGGPPIVALLGKNAVLGALAAGQLGLVLLGLVMLFGVRANDWYKG